MKKNFLWMLAAILLCGSMALTSCSDNTDNPVTPPTPEGDEMPAFSEDFEEMATWVTAAVKRCHPYISQFWNSEADPANFNLLLINESMDKLYLINANGKREIPQSEWDDKLYRGIDEVSNSGYYFLTFQNRCCCLQIISPKAWQAYRQMVETLTGKTMTLQDDAYGVLHTLYHEAFHNFVQDLNLWEKSGKIYNRDQTYPIDYEPRICRKLAFLALVKAWNEPAEAAQQYVRAKYWAQKYRSQFPAEADGIWDVDIVEGTAEYFGRSIIHAAFPDYEILYGIDDYELANSVDDESYQLSVAVHLLRRDGRLEEAIRAFNHAEATPVDFLLKDVVVPANYDESQDAADVAKVRAAMDKYFSEDNPIMSPVVQVVNNHRLGQTSYLVVKNDNPEVYSSSMGTYKLAEFPGFSCIVNMQANYSRFDCTGATLLNWNKFYCLPLADVSHLQLTEWQDIQEEYADFSDVVLTRQATLNAIDDEPTFQMKELPVQVKYGKDTLGNEYFVCF